MPRVRLTAKSVETLPASGIQTDYFDIGANIPGFGLRVSAKRRTWFLVYRSDNTQKRYKLGTAPPLGLADAREAARLQWLENQVNAADPSAAKRARKSADTFETLALRFVEQHSKPHKRSWREDARQLRTMCFPVWKSTIAVDIDKAQVRDLLTAVAKKRGGTSANRLRALLSKLFRWAVGQGYLPGNPAADLPKLARETSRARVLSDDEIRAFWARLDAVEADETLPSPVVLWLRLRLLTAQRGGSVAKMRWADIDEARKVWEIPAADMKAGHSHVVPLSPSVFKLLEERRKNVAADAIYVLEGGRSRRLRLGVTEAIGLENFTPHDLRRTAATGMARAGVQRFVVARVLGHVDRAITGIYDRYEYLNEKRVALDEWDRTLTFIIEGKLARAVEPLARR